MFSQQAQQNRIKQNQSYPQWIKILMLPISWPHEMTHYLTGRALNIPIQRHDFHITYLEKPPLWKDLIITLMPTLLGFSILFSSIFILLVSEPLAEFIFWYGIVMFFTCLSDWVMAYKEVVGRSAQRPTD
ncbi:MAG: hypothetical protein AAF902_13120 [Chloroflexota bacterium]